MADEFDPALPVAAEGVPPQDKQSKGVPPQDKQSKKTCCKKTGKSPRTARHSPFNMTKLWRDGYAISQLRAAMEGWSWCAAVIAVPVRLAWHIGQPLAIWLSMFEYRDEVPDIMFVLLSVRQGLHVLCVLLCTCVNPAYLLVDICASVGKQADHYGRGYAHPERGCTFLAMYVLAPDKFVAMALFGYDHAGFAGLFAFCSSLLDLCALAALGSGIGEEDGLPLELVVAYSVAALGPLFVAGTLVAVRVTGHPGSCCRGEARVAACICFVCILPAFFVPFVLSSLLSDPDGSA
jgi:hypothetical protein